MEFDLTALTSILQTEPTKRSFSSILQLITATSDIQFFKELTQKASDNAHFMCCQYMRYEFFPAGSFVIRYGEIGTSFYIILQGSAVVKTLEDEKASSNNELTEVLRLESGASFGELALEQNKPRSASIKCIEDCHLAVLDKADYKKILLNFVKEKQMELVDFLQSLPLFSKCTKETIRKLTFFFKERICFKNHIIYREGDPAEFVYIIRTGEFKFFKRLILSKSASTSLLGRKILANTLRKNEVSTAPIVILGNGEIFGEEEVMKECYRDMTCVCASNEASVLMISKEDFLKRIKSEESWNFVKQRLALKDMSKSTRILFAHKMKTQEISRYSDITLQGKRTKFVVRQSSPFVQRTDLVSRNYDGVKKSLLYKSVQREMSSKGATSIISLQRPLSTSRSSSAIPRTRNRISTKRSSLFNLKISKSAENICFISKGCQQFRNTPPPSPGIFSRIEGEDSLGMSIVSLTVRPRVRRTVL
jgi:CRP-like cAMP-binding protein